MSGFPKAGGGAPTGPAGGALTGAYPNPGLAKVTIAEGGTNATTAAAALANLGTTPSNAQARYASATAAVGEHTIFLGTTGAQQITLPPAPPAGTINSVSNYSGAATTIAAGSNGGEISTIATWGGTYGGNGVLDVASTADFTATGTILVATSTTVATVTYTGLTATSFTGCAYVSGSATGTVATGGAVTQTGVSIVVAPSAGDALSVFALDSSQQTLYPASSTSQVGESYTYIYNASTSGWYAVTSNDLTALAAILPVVAGGTGASTAAGARTNLGITAGGAVATTNELELTTTNPTSVVTYTPGSAGDFHIGAYFRVTTAITAVTVTVTWTDATGAQTLTILSAVSEAIGSYALVDFMISSAASQAITVTMTAGTANQVYASASILQG